MGDVLYLTAATPGPYMESAHALAGTMAAQGHQLRVQTITPRDTWCENAAAKSAIIAEALEERDGEAVLWLDADARVRKPLDHFERLANYPDEVNLAAHFHYGVKGVELLSGTLYLAGEKGKQLAASWAEACANMVGIWDQHVLFNLWPFVPGLRLEVLPARFTWIREFMGHVCPESDVVVEHLQLSRKYRGQEPGR